MNQQNQIVMASVDENSKSTTKFPQYIAGAAAGKNDTWLISSWL